VLLAACGDTDTGVGGTPAAVAPKVVSSRGVDTGGDRRADVLLLSNTGRAVLWTMNGAQIAAQNELGGVGPDWRVIDASGDYDGDGRTDILWRHTDGTLSIWFMNGATRVATANPGVVDNGWELIDGRGDYDGDGRSDLLWRNAAGTVAIWRMNGGTVVGMSFPATVPLEWSIVDGSGDHDGDGRSDILWRNASGVVAIWRMSGTGIASAAFLPGVGPEWTAIDATGDYDGNGRSDILWRNANGDVLAWYMNGGVAATASLGYAEAAWRVLDAASDFNGDGRSDILWQHSSGQVLLWTVSGTARTSAVSVGTVGAEWHVAAGSGVRAVQGPPPPPAAQCTPGLKGGFSGGADERIVPVVATRRGEVGWFESASPGLGGDGAGGVDGGLGVGVSLGQLSGATIEVEFADGRRYGPQLVGDDGMVTLVSCGYRGTALLSVRGGPGATYYDEARRQDVSFAGQLLQTAVDLDTARRETRGIGITPFTQAALAFLEQTLNDSGNSTASVGEPAKFVAKAPTPGWHDRALVARANDRIREVINEQLPGVYRLQNIARKPILLNARNASTPGTLSDSDSGIYGAVLGGLALTGGASLAGEPAPALAIGKQLAADLADGRLDRLSGRTPITAETAVAYTFDNLWLGKSVGSGLTAAESGDESLRARSAIIGYFYSDTGGGRNITSTTLTADGRITTVCTSASDPAYKGTYALAGRYVVLGGGYALTEDRTQVRGVEGCETLRITNLSTEPLVLSTRESGRRIVDFVGAFWKSGETLIVRLSDGSFATAGRDRRPVPYPFPRNIVAAATEQSISTGSRPGEVYPSSFRPGGRLFGIDTSGRLLVWPRQDPSSTRHLVPDKTFVSVTSTRIDLVLVLASDGTVYWANADTAVSVQQADPQRFFTNPAAAPQRIAGLPAVCWLRGNLAIACEDRAVWEIPIEYVSPVTHTYDGIIALGAPRRRSFPVPIWRVITQQEWNFVTEYFSSGTLYIGVDGRTFTSAQ
jgi:hypothetical protein